MATRPRLARAPILLHILLALAQSLHPVDSASDQVGCMGQPAQCCSFVVVACDCPRLMHCPHSAIATSDLHVHNGKTDGKAAEVVLWCNRRMKLHRKASLWFASLLCALTLASRVGAIRQIIAFGDSITDSCQYGAKYVVDRALNSTKVRCYVFGMCLLLSNCSIPI